MLLNSPYLLLVLDPQSFPSLPHHLCHPSDPVDAHSKHVLCIWRIKCIYSHYIAMQYRYTFSYAACGHGESSAHIHTIKDVQYIDMPHVYIVYQTSHAYFLLIGLTSSKQPPSSDHKLAWPNHNSFYVYVEHPMSTHT